MSIKTFQTGTEVLTGSSASETLSTSVTQSNSILMYTIKGGDATVENSSVKVSLNSAGTSITFDRDNNTGSVTIEWQVIESTAFTCQHKEVAHTGTLTDTSITAVDLDFTFLIMNGWELTGSNFGSNEALTSSLTSTTNLRTECESSRTATHAIIVVEMSSAEIASVQYLSGLQGSTTINTSISSVDTSKTLLFPSAISVNSVLTFNKVPVFHLTSSTNLRSQTIAAITNLDWNCWVVEFVNLEVIHGTVLASSSLTETEVLGGTPVQGGININGCQHISTSNQTNDDFPQSYWAATLSGATWTFTRTANAQDAYLSYSAFDWDTMFDDVAVGPLLLLSNKSDSNGGFR